MDCTVTGGGPAGLTAAIYLARYRLAVTVFDDNTSRAASIPIARNLAGFPDGICGADLLFRIRTQAAKYGTYIANRRASGLRKLDGTFLISFDGGSACVFEKLYHPHCTHGLQAGELQHMNNLGIGIELGRLAAIEPQDDAMRVVSHGNVCRRISLSSPRL